MLTAQQIINLAKKQDWWNEFKRRSEYPMESLARHAIKHKRYDYFMQGAFIFSEPNDTDWFYLAEKFAELCKMEEKKNSIPEYDLVTSKKVVAKFYINDRKGVKHALEIRNILKETNISYDVLLFEPEEKAFFAYKYFTSWEKR